MKRMQGGTENIGGGTGSERDPDPARIAEPDGCVTGRRRRRQRLSLHPVDGIKGSTPACDCELPPPPMKSGEGHTLAPAERGDAQTRGTLPCQQTAPTREPFGNSGLNHAAIIRGNLARAPSDLCVLLRRLRESCDAPSSPEPAAGLYGEGGLGERGGALRAQREL